SRVSAGGGRVGCVRRPAGGAIRGGVARAACGVADAGRLRRHAAGAARVPAAGGGLTVMPGGIDLLVLGVSHRTAPLPVRERLAVAPEQMAETVRAIAKLSSVREVALLS